MKVYISLDLEGVTGVSKFSQINNTTSGEYLLAIEQAHKELNACINGVLRAGFDLITVNDAHGFMTNLNLKFLSSKVELITGKPKLFSMMAGLDNSYSAAILIGYHAMASTSRACLSHTFHEKIAYISINNKNVGEAYINSLFAATKNVPIAFITGDDAVCKEVYAQIGDIPRFAVKEALSFGSVICKPKDLVLDKIENLVYESLCNPTNWIINFQESPFVLEVGMNSLLLADLVGLVPGIRRIGDKLLSYENNDFDEIYKMIQTISMICGCEDSYK